MISFQLDDFDAVAYFRDEYVVIGIHGFEIFYSFNPSTGGIEYGINKDVINRETLDALANHILLNYLEDVMLDLETGGCVSVGWRINTNDI